MRVKVTFSVPIGYSIDMNYQYWLGSWVYRCMNNADPEFTKLWHDKGVSKFESDNRSYKYFTFSNLFFPRYSVKGRKIYSLGREAEIIFTTYSSKVGELFVRGALNSNFRGMEICRIEVMPEPIFQNEAIFKTLSPIHSQRDNIHLNPIEHSDIYAEAIGHNLSVKYNLWHSTNIVFEYPKIEILSEPKAKTIAFKEGTDKEIRNKGYLFTFRITGDPRLIEIGYKAGFGQGNAMGFGCVSLLRPQNHPND